MASKHTPGPWKIDEATDLPLAVIEDTPEGYGVCEMDDLRDEDEVFANAQLIAAAPELLLQLKRMVEYYRHGETRAEAVAKIRDSLVAIAKATGK
jgi:hypothetical protein